MLLLGHTLAKVPVFQVAVETSQFGAKRFHTFEVLGLEQTADRTLSENGCIFKQTKNIRGETLLCGKH
jgi:hypothetical protein